MTSSPRRITPWISVPASLLVWILLLALDMHAMLGAAITSGWIVTGVMVTFSAVFIIWMISEIISAVHTRVVAHESLRGMKPGARPAPATTDFAAWLAGKDRFDVVALQQQRQMLGLVACHVRPNRMRKGR